MSLIQDIRAKREERKKAVEDARAVIDECRAAGRELVGEDKEKYERLHARATELGEQIETLERQDALEREMASTPGATVPVTGQRSQPGREIPAEREAELRAKATEAFIRYGKEDRFRDFSERDLVDYRALSAGTPTAGGYLYPDQQFVNRLVKGRDNRVFIRELATKFQLQGADSMGVPTLDADPADADWTSEIATGSEDSTMAVGKRELRPHPSAKRLKVSKTLVLHAPGVSGLVADRLGYKFGVTEEQAFLTGSGTQRPLGVFTASNDGIPTSQDVSTDNASTSVTFDGLKNAKWALRDEYWGSAIWCAHPDLGKQVDKLKDGEGRYIWQQSVQTGEPDRLLGIPVRYSRYAPNTFTSGQYVAVLGDFSYYWIADSLRFDLQRLDELYAETNQIGFIGRLETDGAPVLAEAFVRVKLG